MCVTSIWKAPVKAAVALTDTQKHDNGMEEKGAAKEMRNVILLMILVHLVMEKMMHTKTPSTI